MSHTDENAYGLFLGYFALEDDEYSMEPEEFAARSDAFRRTIIDHLGSNPPGARAGALDLGHALYIELADGDEATDLFGWLRQARAVLEEAEFRTVAVLTHGSRWVPIEGDLPHIAEPQTVYSGTTPVTRVSLPSEPLRRALYADTASQVEEDEDSGRELGWGPGLYVDTEAIEAMGKKLKNEPTVLTSAGATFFRFGS